MASGSTEVTAVHPDTIASVHWWLVRMPFAADILWGSGRRSGTTRAIVRLETADGTVGWGETIALIDTVPAVLGAIAAKVAVGRSIRDAEGFHRHVLGAGYYHHKRAAVMATAAVEMAMWDALGRRAGLPLWALWGGLWRARVEASAYLVVGDPGIVAEEARRFLDAGHETFKNKIGVSAGSDVPLVEAVRRVVGARDVRADVNGAWTPGTAKRQLAKLAPFDLAYVEQPLELDDLQGHAELRRAQPVPIALDESAYTLADVGNIVRAGAADVVLLDPHEAGGLWQVVKQAAICESVGIPVTLHSGGELALSQAAYVHLAASIPNMGLAIDTEQTYLAGDIAPDGPRLARGGFAVPDRPGLGVTPDPGLIERHRVSEISGADLDPDRPGWFPVKPAYGGTGAGPARLNSRASPAMVRRSERPDRARPIQICPPSATTPVSPSPSGARPGRPATSSRPTPPTRARNSTCWKCSPIPRGASTWATCATTRWATCSRATSGPRVSRCSIPWAGTPSACRPRTRRCRTRCIRANGPTPTSRRCARS